MSSTDLSLPSTSVSGHALGGLLQHLDAQRRHASALIDQHNALLAAVFASGASRPAITLSSAPATGTPPLSAAASPAALPVALPATTAPVIAPAGKKGQVVSLFDYKQQHAAQPVAAASAPAAPAVAKPETPAIPYIIFKENDAEATQRWGETVTQLLTQFGADDALAVNRMQMADTVFLSSAHNGVFYHKCADGVIFAVCYVGSDAHYATTLAELKAHADAHDLQVNLMAQATRVDDLKAGGFSTTPFGIWQRIEIDSYTLEGAAMRRLRYMVSKYAKTGACRTVEYLPGTDPETDRAICVVIDQWIALKGKTPPFTIEVKAQILRGEFGPNHRFFLTYRDAAIDNVMVFSRDNYNNGYLMDLEFYAEGLPLGSTEYALNEIVECFKKEGRKVVSLGLTMGTELFEHENCAKEVLVFFEQLKKANFLNGDANAQYKNKYRPVTTPMFLARPHGVGKKKLNDLMLLLGSA